MMAKTTSTRTLGTYACKNSVYGDDDDVSDNNDCCYSLIPNGVGMHLGRRGPTTGCNALRSVEFAHAVIGSIGFRSQILASVLSATIPTRRRRRGGQRAWPRGGGPDHCGAHRYRKPYRYGIYTVYRYVPTHTIYSAIWLMCTFQRRIQVCMYKL